MRGEEWCSVLLVPNAIPFRLRLRHSDRISSRSGKRRQKGERGFANLEATHFRHAKRLSKLIALLALAFCWAMLTGIWQHQQHPIPFKAHERRAKSLFR